jgi:hypothetical protein
VKVWLGSQSLPSPTANGRAVDVREPGMARWAQPGEPPGRVARGRRRPRAPGLGLLPVVRPDHRGGKAGMNRPRTAGSLPDSFYRTERAGGRLADGRCSQRGWSASSDRRASGLDRTENADRSGQLPCFQTPNSTQVRGQLSSNAATHLG